MKNNNVGTSLGVQWLSLCVPNAGAEGLIPGWGTKIPYATQHDQKIKIKKKCVIFELHFIVFSLTFIYLAAPGLSCGTWDL